MPLRRWNAGILFLKASDTIPYRLKECLLKSEIFLALFYQQLHDINENSTSLILKAFRGNQAFG